MEKQKQKFIVRCDRAGVFYGEIEERNGKEVLQKTTALTLRAR